MIQCVYCSYKAKNDRERTDFTICDNCKNRIREIKCRICGEQAVYGWFDDNAKWHDAYCRNHEYIAKTKEDIEFHIERYYDE